MSDEKKTILLVEDNPDNSMLALKILQHAGYEVFLAEDGYQALDYCKENIPQLILMDISLPGIDGFEVTKNLREMDTFSQVPIIALTAHALDGFSEKNKAAGCNDYLTKPYLPKDLKEIITKHIPKS